MCVLFTYVGCVPNGSIIKGISGFGISQPAIWLIVVNDVV